VPLLYTSYTKSEEGGDENVIIKRREDHEREDGIRSMKRNRKIGREEL